MKLVAVLRALAQWIPALAVSGFGLALTFNFVAQQRTAQLELARARFSEEVRAAGDAIAQRLVAYSEVVAGVRDLFLLDPALSHEQFARIVAGHDVRRSYPEVRNLSFVRAGEDAGAAAGLPLPAYVVEYLWPPEGNAGVLGLDIRTQPANLASFLAGRASGEATVSAPFELIQEADGRKGFMVRFPVFIPALATESARGHFLGAVAASVDASAMLEALQAQGFFRGLALRIEDVGDAQAGTQAAVPVLVAASASWTAHVAPAMVERELAVQDRRWRLSFRPATSLLSQSERQLPHWITGGGVLLSLLLGGLAGLLGRRHRRALHAVDRTSRALQLSEDRFRAVFNQAAVGMSLTDADSGRLLRVNRKFAEILGYGESELLQRGVQELIHPEDLAADDAELQAFRRGAAGQYHAEKRLRHRDGHWTWIDLNMSPVFSEDGGLAWHVIIIDDVTQRRQMEDALRASVERMRSIFDHLPVAVIWIDADARIVFRNQRFMAISGYGEQQVYDVDSWWSWAYPDPRLRERSWQRWQHAVDQARSSDGRVGAEEYDICCGDGAVRTVLISGVLLGDEQLIFVEDLSARKEAEREINYLAFFDPLTGLPNRRYLLDRLPRIIAASARRQRYGALFMLDLDHFKTLNETRGHEYGDRLLREVAVRLRTHTHEDDTLVRHGDDEFVLVVEDLADSEKEAATRAEEAGRHLLEALRQPYELGEFTHHATVSMGVSLFIGAGNAADELLRRADMAMNKAKGAGRNALCFYDPALQEMVSARAALELDMRFGLESGQFQLYYQPQLEDDRIFAAEALLRWRHPRDGFISPAVFVALAEDTGLISRLGAWVLETACQQLARWAGQRVLGGLSLAVNVSPWQFRQHDFVDQVLAALARTGAEPRRLKLELTEGLLLQDIEDTVAKMARLKSYGVGFSLDDFGTGYSSLAYLKRLPLDQLKIDQSFVRDVLVDPNDAAIARTIVALANSLGLEVIAEGVETVEQLEFLRRNHCRAWQGYLFSKPLPADEFEALLLRP